MEAQLERYLEQVEGGNEVLAARKRELAEAEPPHTKAAKNIREENRLMYLERLGEAHIGSGKLPKNLWDLPMPDDPNDSVRGALAEDREDRV